jgi:predicted nucleic acid-binding protein
MKTVFADTFYWIALANPKDEWHQAAINASKRLGQVHLVTTDEVLVEFLAFMSGYGSVLRGKAVERVKKIRTNPNITLIPQTRQSFSNGLQLYEGRPDKAYSLTDCISMETMRAHGIQEVLTHDNHFKQEGFNILLTDKNG